MKRAIIFGATGGIGRAIAENMAENGWSLYIHYNHNQQEAGKMVQEFIENYPDQEFFSLKLNFLAEDDVIKKIISNLLPISAVIFTQGITNYQFLGSQELDEIEKIIQINLLAPIKITSLLESQLLKQAVDGHESLSACPYVGILNLTREDGETLQMFVANDSCDSITYEGRIGFEYGKQEYLAEIFDNAMSGNRNRE